MTARQCIATLCFVALLPGCVTFQPYEGDGPPIGEPRVRVTRTSGESIVLATPEVENGEFAGLVRENGVQSVVRIPMESIAGFEVSRPDGRLTAKAIGFTVAAIGGFIYLIATSVTVNPLGG